MKGKEMIQINQIKLKIPHTEDQLVKKIKSVLKLKDQDFFEYKIVKRSLDARRKPELFYIYTVNVEYQKEHFLEKRIKNPKVRFHVKEEPYICQITGENRLEKRPVIIGTGPAGLFCGYQLAKLGYQPILLERGEDVENRQKDVEEFWNGGPLKHNSNVQFGEGGAGTFSDGKLNTLVHDKKGRNKEVLRILHQFGGNESIMYDQKPHLGTDVLKTIVKNMRNEIVRLGGEVRFHSQVTDFRVRNSQGEQSLHALTVCDTHTNETYELETKVAVFAIGHSARDTFEMLSERGLHMTPKSFAVGVRIEHLQQFINESQYGKGYPKSLPAAAYKLTANTSDQRGVYTFCMCPGGYVVNASSEEGLLAVNGMSYSGRDGVNANSAVIVTVTPEDFEDQDALAGVRFQQKLERNAFLEGKGKIPVQLLKDFFLDQASHAEDMKEILPQMKGEFQAANVRSIFPENLALSLAEGIQAFDKKIKGYANDHAVVSGVESRTSSPLRIIRKDEDLQSNIRGIYPCGEGAGYAGGITSAAMDGLKVAESICQEWRYFDN